MDRFIFYIKDYREREGITQAVLSERTGICRKTIALLEQQAGCNPNLGTLKRVAAYFDVTVDQLIKAQIEGDQIFV